MEKFSVVIVFNEEGKVLFGRRNDNKLWANPAGGVEENETPLMGAVRELREETNIRVTPDKLKFKGMQIVTDTVSGDKLEVYLYTTKVNSKKIILSNKLDPDAEFFQYRWVNKKLPVSFLENLHIPRSKNVVVKYLSGDVELDSVYGESFGDKIKKLRAVMESVNSDIPKGYIRSLHGFGGSVNKVLLKEKDFELIAESDKYGKVFIYEDKTYYYTYYEKINRSARVVEKVAKSKEEIIDILKKSIDRNGEALEEYDKNEVDKGVTEYISQDDLKELRALIKGKLRKSDEYSLVIKDGYASVYYGINIKRLKKKLSVSVNFEILTVDFSSLKGKDVRIKADEGRLASNDKEVAYYPINNFDDSRFKTLPSKLPMTSKFKAGMARVLSAVDTGNPKYELNGMLVQTVDGKTTIVGTDTRRLTIYEEETALKDSEVIIPKEALDIKVSEIREVSFDSEGRFVYVDSDNYEIHSPMINGRYPDFKRIIPQFPDLKYTLDSKEFKKALGKSKEPVVSIEDGTLSIKEVEMGHDKENDIPYVKGHKTIGSMKVKEAKDFKVAFDAKYVIDAIGDSKTFVLSANETNKPFVIDADGKKSIIMPIVV